MPATFTIRPGENVTPPTVSAPAGVPVELTLVSADGRRHSAVVKLNHQRRLNVPAHGRVSILLAGLPAGTYVIEVDGVSGAGLVIGVEPGP